MRVIIFLLFLLEFVNVVGQQLDKPLRYERNFFPDQNELQGSTSKKWRVGIKKSSIKLFENKLTDNHSIYEVGFGYKYIVGQLYKDRLEILTEDEEFVGWVSRSDLLLSDRGTYSSVDYMLLKALVSNPDVTYHSSWNPSGLQNDSQISVGLYYVLDVDEQWLLINSRPGMSYNARWILWDDAVEVISGSHKYQTSKGAVEAIPISEQSKEVFITQRESVRIMDALEILQKCQNWTEVKKYLVERGAENHFDFYSFLGKYVLGYKATITGLSPSRNIKELDNFQKETTDHLKAYCNRVIEKLDTLHFDGIGESINLSIQILGEGFLDVIPAKPVSEKGDDELTILEDSSGNASNGVLRDLTVFYVERPDENEDELIFLRSEENLKNRIREELNRSSLEVHLIYPCSNTTNLCSEIVTKNNLEDEVEKLHSFNGRPSIDWQSRMKVKQRIREYVIHNSAGIRDLNLYYYVNSNFSEYEKETVKVRSFTVIGDSSHEKLIKDAFDEFIYYTKNEIKFYVPEGIRNDLSGVYPKKLNAIESLK